MSETPAFEACRQGLIGQRRPDNGGEDFMHVGEPLDRIGQGLLVDLGVLRPDAVAEGAVGGGGECQLIHSIYSTRSKADEGVGICTLPSS